MNNSFKNDNRIASESNGFNEPSDVFDILSASSQTERPMVICDDEVMCRLQVDIDLVHERIGHRLESAHDLRQQAIDEDEAANKLHAALDAAVARIHVARAS